MAEVPQFGTCAVGGTVRTSRSNGVETINVALTGTCAPDLGGGHVSLSATGDMACGGAATGVGGVSINWPTGALISGMAQFVIAHNQAGVLEIDSIVPDPSARNRRIVVLLHTTLPIVVTAAGGAGGGLPSVDVMGDPPDVEPNVTVGCGEGNQVATAVGTVTAAPITAEQATGGAIEGCDTQRPLVGVNPDNSPNEFMPDCRPNTDLADNAVGEVAVLGTSTLAPTSHAVMGSPVLPDRVCEQRDYFRPKDRKPDRFDGKVVAAAETGNNPGHLSYTDTASFTSGVTVKASVTIKEDIIIAGAEQTFGVDVSVDWTTSNTRGHSIDIPPHSHGIIEYGHWHIITNGEVVRIWDDCVSEVIGTATLEGPYVQGFRGN